MASKQRDKAQIDWRSDWWLWPSALLLAVGGWGQVIWMWENIHPTGLAPLWLLLGVGVGVAGLALPVHWLAHRWWALAWAAAAAWAGVPLVDHVAAQYSDGAKAGDNWLSAFSPLLMLLLLGIGLSGLMAGVSSYARRRWSSFASKIRPLREGFWSGLFVLVCGWLLINRAFTLGSVALLAGALILIEVFLVMRELSREQSGRRRK